MNTIAVKQSIIKSFYEIVKDLTLEEIEDIKDKLTIQEFELTDDGEYISLEEVEKDLETA